MKRLVSACFSTGLLLALAPVMAAEPRPADRGNLILKLGRGICIDRQVHSIPPAPDQIVQPGDVHLIKAMGFGFVKLIFNPEVFKSGGGLDESHMAYFDQIVDYGIAEKLPVVICIHPEVPFKKRVVGSRADFDSFASFMQALSRHVAARWNSDQVALQLMTEPPPASRKSAAWNYWDRLQRRLWQTVRSEMPRHTLILSGDMGGTIEGMDHASAVEDENVLYAFTFYEPHLFTLQGIGGSPKMGGLKGVPFPSGPQTLAQLPKILEGVPPQFQEEMKRQVQDYAAQQWDEKKVSDRIARLDAWRQRSGGKAKLWCGEFGCLQGAPQADRSRYIELMRRLFDRYKIGWSYWSYNETFSIMTPDRTPSGPAAKQTPDRAILHALMPDKY